MMHEYFRHQQLVGTAFEDDQLVVLFGVSAITREDLPRLFPVYRFHSIRQVHGDTCVEASSLVVDADAHWSRERGVALAVQTADCLPVLVYDPLAQMILSIHAGWRGVANNIIGKSIRQVMQNPSTARVWIGPHIRIDSFEVGLDVEQQLLAAAPATANSVPLSRPHSDPTKRHVDLTRIAHLQLQACGVTSIWTSPEDTFRENHYHSFRRDKTSGRQWSWIALK